MQAHIDPYRPTPRRTHLAHGSRYRVRPSGEGDRQLLLDCFEALSADTKRLRFFNSKPTLTQGELDYFACADGQYHIACVAVRLDGSGQEAEALGFARCVRLSPGSEVAEFSITVIDEAQGQGIGSVLLEYIIGLALGVGIRRFRCEVLAENFGMRNLAQHLGGEPQWLGDGIVEYDCALPETPAPAGADLPWFLDPRGLVSPWADAWLNGLGDSLTLIQSSQQGVERWLADLCPACAGEAVAA
jgi:GNAT superfamily N-acetyltransferase